VLAYKLENSPFQQQHIIDGIKPYALDTMPGPFPMTRRNIVHDIIRNQEVRVQLRASCHEKRIEVQGPGLTNTTAHPRIAAFSYSESSNSLPLNVSAVSTTRRPVLYLPVKVL